MARMELAKSTIRSRGLKEIPLCSFSASRNTFARNALSFLIDFNVFASIALRQVGQ